MPDDIFQPTLEEYVDESGEKKGPLTNANGQLKGYERMDRARPRIVRWLDERLMFGFSEWNAPGYYEEDICALLNLIDFCRDPQIQRQARMVMDLLVFDLARFTQGGSFGVTAGRARAEHKRSGWKQSVGELIQILFATRGYVNPQALQRTPWVSPNSDCAHAFCTSTRYCTPPVLLAIGRDRPSTFIDRSRVSIRFDEARNYAIGFKTVEDVLFWWGHSALATKETIVGSRTVAALFGLQKLFEDQLPGILLAAFWTMPERLLVNLADKLSVRVEGMALTKANLYTFRNKDVMLSSIQSWRRGQVGYQVQCWQATIDCDVAVWTTYPAAGQHSEGPDWWTGSAVIPRLVQRGDAAIVMYAPDPFGYQFFAFGHRTHIWWPEKDFEESLERRQHGANVDGVWFFGRKGKGYIGIFSAQHDSSLQNTGTWAHQEILCDGLRNVFVVQVGNEEDYGPFSDFVETCVRVRINVSKGVFSPLLPFTNVQCSYDMPHGRRLSVTYDDEWPYYHGSPFSDDDFPRFSNPYVQASWNARQYTISHHGLSLTHDQVALKRTGDGL